MLNMKTICVLIAGLAALSMPLLPAARAQEAAAAPPVEDAYQLQPGDKVYFRIEEDPAPARSAEEVVAINALSVIQFPVTRGSDVMVTVNVKGKTLAQVRQELKTKLDEDYYVDCHLRLGLKDQSQRPGKVLFTGAVKSNVLQLTPGATVTIYEAIAQVGTTEFANLKKVVINRVDPASQKPRVITVDIDQIRKDRSRDIPLQDGDRVDVKEKGLLY